MSSYYGSKRFPYLYDARHTIEELEEMYERTDNREKKRQIRRIINERINPPKEKSDAYAWSQKHNFLLFMGGGLSGNIGSMLAAMRGLQKNSIYRRYSAEYREILEAIQDVDEALKRVLFLLKNISALRKEDRADEKQHRANRP